MALCVFYGSYYKFFFVPDPKVEVVENKVYDLVINKSRTPANVKYELGIALSGGGIKALCHAGVLKAFEEHGLKPDIISGVSGGAIVAALYADGYSPDSILEIFKNADYLDFFDFKMSGKGVLSMYPFRNFIDEKLRHKYFADMPVKLRFLTTDFDRGVTIVLDSGRVSDAVAASSSVPILFVPYKLNGRNCVDGGVLQNLPVSTIRYDTKVVVGVNTGPMDNTPYDKNLFSIALRAYKYIYRNNAAYNKELCDFLIEPQKIVNFNSADITSMDSLFNIGYEKADKLLNMTNNLSALDIIK